MTWIACGFCHDVPCRCRTLCAPQPTYQSFAATVTWPSDPAIVKLPDEDVERIAKRVAELLNGAR